MYPEEILGFHKYSFFGFSNSIYEDDLFKKINENILNNF